MIMRLGTLSDDSIRELLEEPELVEQVVAEGLPGESWSELCMEKSWHGVHYLLTGTAWDGEPPLNFLLDDGTEVGDIDVGYGPARVLTAKQTRDVQRALATLDDDSLKRRHDPKDMQAKEIYPAGTWEQNPVEDLQFLMHYVAELRGLLTSAADRNLGLLIWIE
jgi:hypothetical protein